MSELLISKYYPNNYNDIIINRHELMQIDEWIKNFEKDKKTYLDNKITKGREKRKAFLKKPSLLILGSHGIGKSMLVDLVLKVNNIRKVKLDLNNIKNASKEFILKLLSGMNILNKINNINENTSTNDKYAIVIDELESVITVNEKKVIQDIQKINNIYWKCPIIFISNNKHNKLLNVIKGNSIIIKLKLPYDKDMYTLINKICIKENIKFNDNNIINKLIAHSQSDIRRLFRILQDMKDIKNGTIISSNFIDKYCIISKKKDIDMELFKATDYLLLKYNNINECLRIYEMDKPLLPLMIHHNYINFIINKNGDMKDKYKIIFKISKLISYGDIIENYIYSDQNWNLHQLHGIFVCGFTSYYLNNSNLNGINIKSSYINENIYIKKDKEKEDIEGSDKSLSKFAADLNRTSIKHINKKNIIASNKIFNNMNIIDYIYLAKIINNLLSRKMIRKCADIMIQYNLEITDLDILMKIDKIKEKYILQLKDKKELENIINNNQKISCVL